MPREIALALRDSKFSFEPWSARTELAALRRSGHADRIARAAASLRAGLVPVDRQWLSDRLTLLWTTMSVGSTEGKATAWLHETHRLLADLPHDLVADAIDAAVKAAVRGFMPTIGEIRVHADARFADRQQAAMRAEALANLHVMTPLGGPGASGGSADGPVAERCSPAAAAEIIAELNLRSDRPAPARRQDGPARAPTRADYLAMGVDPAVLDPAPDAPTAPAADEDHPFDDFETWRSAAA